VALQTHWTFPVARHLSSHYHLAFHHSSLARAQVSRMTSSKSVLQQRHLLCY